MPSLCVIKMSAQGNDGPWPGEQTRMVQTHDYKWFLCRRPGPDRQREIQAQATTVTFPVSLGRAVVKPLCPDSPQNDDKMVCPQEGFSWV